MSKVKFKVIHQVSPSFMWKLNCIPILIGKEVFCDSRLSICEYKIWHKNTQVVSCVLYTNNNGENRLRNWIFIFLSRWYFLTKENTYKKLTSTWNNVSNRFNIARYLLIQITFLGIRGVSNKTLSTIYLWRHFSWEFF